MTPLAARMPDLGPLAKSYLQIDPAVVVPETWAALTTSGSFSARARNMGLHMDDDNGVLYVIGGSSASSSYNNDVQALDLATSAWTVGASCPVSFRWATIQYYNGEMWVFSPRTPTSYTTSVYAYNISTNTWRSAGSLLSAFRRPNSVIVGNVAYILGSNPAGSSIQFQAYNLDTEVATSLSVAGLGGIGYDWPTLGHHDGKIYAIGGYRSSSYTNVVACYSISGDSWTDNLTTMAENVSEPAYAIVGSTVVIGGHFTGSSYTDRVLHFDMETETASDPGLTVPDAHSGGFGGFYDGEIVFSAGYNTSASFVSTTAVAT